MLVRNIFKSWKRLWIAVGCLAVLLYFLFPLILESLIESRIRLELSRLGKRAGVHIEFSSVNFPESGQFRLQNVTCMRTNHAADRQRDSLFSENASAVSSVSNDLLIYVGSLTGRYYLLGFFSGNYLRSVELDSVFLNVAHDSSGFNVEGLWRAFEPEADSIGFRTHKEKEPLLRRFWKRIETWPVPEIQVRHSRMLLTDTYTAFHKNPRRRSLRREAVLITGISGYLHKTTPNRLDYEFKSRFLHEHTFIPLMISGSLDPSSEEIRSHLLFDRPVKAPFLDSFLEAALYLQECNLSAVTRHNADSAFIDAGLNVQDMSLVSDAMARTKIRELNFNTRLNLAIVGDTVIVLAPTSLTLNRIKVHAEGVMIAGDNYPCYRLKISIPRTSFTDLFESIPSAFMTQLEGIRMNGSFEYELGISVDMARLDSLSIDARMKTSSDFRLISLGDSINVKKLRSDFDYTVTLQNGADSTFRVGKENPYFVPYDSLPPHLVHAVLLSEDGSFFKNDGFNILQVERSVAENIRAKKFVRGASTISMQFVKNIYLSREKTLSRKFQELIITWLMNKERMLDEYRNKEKHKKRLLEIYFNIIEWGPDIFGIGRASEFYFKKRAADLTVQEAVFLATIIPNPKRYDWYFRNGELRKNKKDNMALLSRLLYQNAVIDRETWEQCFQTDLTFRGEAYPLILEQSAVDSLSKNNYLNPR